jgi:hypothetical protein
MSSYAVLDKIASVLIGLTVCILLGGWLYLMVQLISLWLCS